MGKMLLKFVLICILLLSLACSDDENSERSSTAPAPVAGAEGDGWWTFPVLEGGTAISLWERANQAYISEYKGVHGDDLVAFMNRLKAAGFIGRYYNFSLINEDQFTKSIGNTKYELIYDPSYDRDYDDYYDYYIVVLTMSIVVTP
jgi:hypothetical protein